MRKIALRTCRLSQRAAVAIAYKLAFDIRPVTLDYTVFTCAKNDMANITVIFQWNYQNFTLYFGTYIDCLSGPPHE